MSGAAIGTDYSIEYPDGFAAAASAAHAQPPVLTVSGLGIDYLTRSGESVPALRDVDLTIRPGSMTAVVGESGSGKTTTASAVIGLLAANAQVRSGSIVLGAHGTDPELELGALGPREWKKVRGRRIGYIPQDPGTSLNPVKTVGENVAESLRLHTALGAEARRARVVELLDRVGIDRAAMRADQYPHELSGGMRQRALIAAAIAVDPQLLIADEPTSALDVTVQKRILDLLDELRREAGTGILFITHDLAVAAERADALLVVRRGHVEESGPASRLLRRPESAYTRRLLADAPAMQSLLGGPEAAQTGAAEAAAAEAGMAEAGTARADTVEAGSAQTGSAQPDTAQTATGEGTQAATGEGAQAGTPSSAASGAAAVPSSDHFTQPEDAGRLGKAITPEADADSPPLVTVSGLTQVYARVPRDEHDADAGEQIIGIEDVSFTVARGTTLGLVGESGSGKSTIGRALTGFLAPQSGSIRVGELDAAHLDRRGRRAFRRTVQLVHQNPASALDPVHSVGASIEEPLRNFRIGSRAERRTLVEQALERVALDPSLASRRPRELSGGQLQRVAIARALVIEPELVVFDEAVSALDVTVQSQILELIDGLQRELGLTYVFISHDLAVVRQVAHTVTVMSAGRQVESGPVADVFSRPGEAYTKQLLAAIPRPLETQVLDHQALSI
ncbi:MULTISPECIES: dipeptide ABC transporter ATP-binding protein [Brevibacterium]|uniref:Dipeptide ABC transporter ATP-binding protein n=1 Tax=Brevibacterium salitolerans TaxID=1403566 RepID=A0ABP5I422_9MICO|nr:ABC transporter ATP-binding protein [Brevibacterium sp.]